MIDCIVNKQFDDFKRQGEGGFHGMETCWVVVLGLMLGMAFFPGD